MKCKQPKQAFLTIFLLCLLLVSAFGFLRLGVWQIKPAHALSTFGWNGIGDSSSLAVDAIRAGGYLSNATGYIVSIHARVGEYSNAFGKLLLYNSTYALIAESSNMTFPLAPAFVDYNFATPLTMTNQTYWVAVYAGAETAIYRSDTTVGSQSYASDTGTYPTSPTTLVPTLYDKNMSVYVTYTNSLDAPTYSNLGVSATNAGKQVTFTCEWDSTVGLDTGVFGTNGTQTGAWIYRDITFSSTPAWQNVSLTLPPSSGTTVSYVFNATDTLGTTNTTGIKTMVTTTAETPSTITFESDTDFKYGYLGDGRYVIYTDEYAALNTGTSFHERGGYGAHLFTGSGDIEFEPNATLHVNGTQSAALVIANATTDGRRREEVLHDYDSETTQYINETAYYYFPSSLNPLDGWVTFQRIIYERMWNESNTITYQYFQISLSALTDGREATLGQQIFVLDLGKGDVDNDDDGETESWECLGADLYSNTGASMTVPDSWNTTNSVQVPYGSWFKVSTIVYRNFANYSDGYVTVYINDVLTWNITHTRTIGIDPTIMSLSNHNEFVNPDVAYFCAGFGLYTDEDTANKTIYIDDLTYSQYMPTASSVAISIVYPTNTTYATSTVLVQLSAYGGIIDTIWWNCKSGASWVYGANQTYTAPTSMTGLGDGAYTFYGWANNTDGDNGEDTVAFTVSGVTHGTLASTELLNWYAMTSAEWHTFIDLLAEQNITHFILRGMAMYEWDDTSWTTVDTRIAWAKGNITVANAHGIEVSYDLHTWYTTWDSYFRQTASNRDANRAKYIDYVEHVLTKFQDSNVYAFMVLNEPQGRNAVSGENQFILDVIAAAKSVTTKPVSVRFMGGWSPNTGAYSVAIDAACDFICRNTYWDARYPTVEVYQCSEADLLGARDYAHANSKEFWVTEFGKAAGSSPYENQRSFVEAWVDWANAEDVDDIYCWASQPEAGSGESYNIFTGYTPRPAFYELVNEVEEEPPLGDNVVMLNQPNNLESFDYFTILFNYTAIFYQGSIVNSSLWTNRTGSWALTQSNTTAIVNGTMHTISYTFIAETTYIWNIRVFNSTTAHWATSNRTLTIETTPPSDNPPTYGDYSVSSTMAGEEAIFQMPWWDDVSLVYGWLSHNNTGTWVNETVVPMFTPHLTFSYTLTLNSSMGIVVSFRFYANDTANQENATAIYTLTTGYFIAWDTSPSGLSAYGTGFNLYFLEGSSLAFQHMPIVYQAVGGTALFTVESGIWNGTNGQLSMYASSGSLSFEALHDASLSFSNVSEFRFTVNGELYPGGAVNILNGQSYTIEWQSTGVVWLLPFTFIIGMVGLASSFAGPMYAIYKVKKGEYYEGMRMGVIITALGFALTIAWLWSV